MPNSAIEIHDSILDGISFVGGSAVLGFSSVYIHKSFGMPGVDAGTGWVQEARLQITNAIIKRTFSQFPAELLDGCIALGESAFDNVIPIPLSYTGNTELRLESWNSDVVLISGDGAELELVGEPEFVEEFRPNPRN